MHTHDSYVNDHIVYKYVYTMPHFSLFFFKLNPFFILVSQLKELLLKS